MTNPPLGDGETGPLRLTLVPQRDPDGIPAAVRFRRLLKIALRSFGLRCTDIEPVTPTGPLQAERECDGDRPAGVG